MSNVPIIVTADWLAERLEDSELRLIDATTFLDHNTTGYYDVWSGEEAYDKEHIPGAVFADLLKDFSNQKSDYSFTVPSREQFVENAEKLGIGDADTYVVVYDQGAIVDSPIASSDWASRFAWQLKYEGFENVAILDGGLPKWKAEGRDTTAEPGSYPEADFKGERNGALFSTKEDVLDAIEDENTVIIDSLDEGSYKGEENTYGRPGHIPGSKNIFFGDSSNHDTKELYDDEKLKEIFEKTGALDPDKKVITYCGSGIAATWNGILLNKLGQNNVSVYDGSLTEWAQDESLPLETEE